MLFPLFALALDLPERYFDDKVKIEVLEVLVLVEHSIDKEFRCHYECIALPAANRPCG